MVYCMPKWLAFLVRVFPGIKKNLINFSTIKNAQSTMCDGVIFPYDMDLMDRKRFVAIAAGAIEMDEIIAAQKYINSEDVIVELGAGIGIAAARINKTVKPKKHICFEANSRIIPYLKNLFQLNEMNVIVENIALGDDTKIKFYALDDYILSSFTKPKNRNDFTEIDVTSMSCQKIIDDFVPSAIFCDIEGAELDYLDASHFKSVKTIVIELHPNIYGSAGIQTIYERLERHGFKKSDIFRDTHCFTR